MKLGKRELERSIDSAIALLKSAPKDGMIRIVSHLDTDGICSCAILAKALGSEGYRYSVSILPQLDERSLAQLSADTYKTYVFSDMGSAALGIIKRLLRGKTVIILDHHKPDRAGPQKNVAHVNPHLYGIDGSRELSGSGVTYLFARQLDRKNKSLAHLAVVGAVGDSQEKGGFSGLNREILSEAVRERSIVVSKGLRFFGAQSRPLHKVLEYSFDPFIPGVTGSADGAKELLGSLGIGLRYEKRYRRLEDLTASQRKALAEEIIRRRKGEDEPGDVFGNVYTLANERPGPFRDARELSTLLNACGRLGRASVGISALLGDKKSKRQAEELVMEYRQEIISSLEWFRKSEGTKDVIRAGRHIIINAGYNIMPTMIGTMASIIANSSEVEKGSVIIALGRTENKKTKVSVRLRRPAGRLDAYDIVSRLVKVTGGECGGHKNAAGGLIEPAKERLFMAQARQVLKKIDMEETI